MDVTTHLRARALQAGAVMALVGGTLVVAASPAQAAPPTVDITNVSSTTIGSGERTTVKYTVTNNNLDVPPNQSAAVRIQVNGGGMNCSGDCSPATTIDPDKSREFSVTLTAPGVDPGATKSLRVQVTATLNNESASDAETITVRGPEKPQQVRQISGTVRDTDRKAISGAQVAMKDSAGHEYETTTNGDGLYAFTSSDAKPIAPGPVSVGAIKDGFKPESVNVQAGAGKTVNATLTLTPNAATPSPTPSATVEPSAAPLDAATDDATAETPGETAGADPRTASNNDDSGSGSLLFIILGGLLVAAGVGAIVLVLMRRKGDAGEDDAPAGAGGVVPPSQGGGRYGDATRVAAPVGGGANDATMVASISGAPSISDAPTMLQRPVVVEDEFPDPYGAPAMPPQVTYGATAAGTYGAAPGYGGNAYGSGAAVPAQSGGYDDGYAGPPTQYGRPVPQEDPYATYASQQPGYGGGGEQQRYDEPTGMYRPEQEYDQGGYHAGPADGGYHQEPEYPPAGHARPEPTGAYQGGAYGQPTADQGGYGSWGAPAEGLDNGNAYGPSSGAGGYGAAPAGGGTYGAPAGGGYESAPPARGGATYGGGQGGGTYGGGYPDQAGYPDQGGYGDPAGYDPRAAYGRLDAGGYDRGQHAGYAPQQGGGYDQQGYDQGHYAGDQYGSSDQGGARHGSQAARPPQEPTHPGQRRLDWLDD